MVLPLLPSLLSMVPMPVLADMLPTLLELSMLPSVRLSQKLMLKLFTIPTEDMVLDTVSILLDMVMGMVIMLDSATRPLAMVMVMVLDILATMASAKLRLSQRLMLSMEPTDMVMDLDTVHTPLDMADTLAMDTDMGAGIDMGMDTDTMVELLSVNQQILVRSIL